MKSFIQPARFVRAASLALLASTAVVTMTAVPAMAQISAGDLAAIGTAVANAINAAKAGLPAGASQAQVDAAVAAAIASETNALIGQYSSDNPELVAEAVITAAGDVGASAGAIGTGMADAALGAPPGIGKQIADAVGNTGQAGSVTSFENTANASGTKQGQELADDAGNAATVGARGNGNGLGGGQGNGGNNNGQGNGGRDNGFGNGGGGGGGCSNPSCT
jgi:hypothetical protein